MSLTFPPQVCFCLGLQDLAYHCCGPSLFLQLRPCSSGLRTRISTKHLVDVDIRLLKRPSNATSPHPRPPSPLPQFHFLPQTIATHPSYNTTIKGREKPSLPFHTSLLSSCLYSSLNPKDWQSSPLMSIFHAQVSPLLTALVHLSVSLNLRLLRQPVSFCMFPCLSSGPFPSQQSAWHLLKCKDSPPSILCFPPLTLSE